MSFLKNMYQTEKNEHCFGEMNMVKASDDVSYFSQLIIFMFKIFLS